MLIAMIATQLIEKAGLFAIQGERLNVTPIQAAMLKYQGLARFATASDDQPAPEPPPPPDPEPEPAVAAAPRRRTRTYRRRDMQAER